MGASGGVFSPSCDASHLHPAPLQQHQAAQDRPGHHSSSAAGALLFARANRLLLGSDLPRGSLGAAPALGCLGPRPARGLRPSTHSRLLGDYAAAFGWWPDWLAGKQPRPVPLRLSRLLGLRSSGRGEHQKGKTHRNARPSGRWAKATDQRWPGCSRAGRQVAATRQATSAKNGPLGSPRSQGAEQVCSPDAVRRQHGSFSRATGRWLAGRCETPPQHAPTARTSKG